MSTSYLIHYFPTRLLSPKRLKQTSSHLLFANVYLFLSSSSLILSQLVSSQLSLLFPILSTNDIIFFFSCFLFFWLSITFLFRYTPKNSLICTITCEETGGAQNSISISRDRNPERMKLVFWCLPVELMVSFHVALSAVGIRQGKLDRPEEWTTPCRRQMNARV